MIEGIISMMMISIDNVEHYLFKGICVCSLGVKLTLFRRYCSSMYTVQLWWNYKKSTITKLQIAYHNIF